MNNYILQSFNLPCWNLSENGKTNSKMWRIIKKFLYWHHRTKCQYHIWNKSQCYWYVLLKLNIHYIQPMVAYSRVLLIYFFKKCRPGLSYLKTGLSFILRDFSSLDSYLRSDGYSFSKEFVHFNKASQSNYLKKKYIWNLVWNNTPNIY